MDSNDELVAPPLDLFRAAVTCLSHTTTCLANIKNHLSEEQLQRFRESCFGHLLSIGELQFSGQLVHSLLMRGIKSKVNFDSMSFMVEDKVLQFSSEDFHLISGLRIGNCPTLKVDNSRLKTTYFDGKRTVSLKDLKEAFVSCTDEEDKFKLSLVYFAEFVLLGRETHSKLELKYLALVDDLQSWKSYPWGTVSFEKTMKSLTTAALTRYQIFKNQQAERKATRDKYSLRGFAYVFQIWAYESLPILSEHKFAEAVESTSSARILHWASVDIPTYDKLYKNAFSTKKVDVLSICPMDVGKEPKIWTLEGECEATGDVKYVQDLVHNDVEDGNKTVVAANGPTLPTKHVHSLRVKFKRYKSKMRKKLKDVREQLKKERKLRKKTKKELRVVNARLVGVQKKLKVFMDAEHGALNLEEPSDVDNALDTVIVNDRLLVHDEDLAPCSVPVEERDSQILTEAHDRDGKKKSVKRNASHLIPNFTAVKMVKRRRAVDSLSKIPQADMLELIELLEKWKSNPSEKLDLGLYTVDSNFFMSLIEPAHCLNGKHIDIGLQMLRKRRHDYPDYFGHRWTTTEEFFMEFVKKDYTVFRDIKEESKWDPRIELVRYINGEIPDYSLPWSAVDKVYVPCFVHGNHWVLAVVDLEARTITIYDSLRDPHQLSKTNRLLKPLSALVPHLLLHCGFYSARADLKCEEEKMLIPFRIQSASTVPQQDNGGDCGVFMLKFVEYLTSGATIDTCVQENMDFFRLKFAIEFLRKNAYMQI